MLREYSHTVWKLGRNPYYHGWNTAFFLGDCFLLAHPVYKSEMNTLPMVLNININRWMLRTSSWKNLGCCILAMYACLLDSDELIDTRLLRCILTPWKSVVPCSILDLCLRPSGKIWTHWAVCGRKYGHLDALQNLGICSDFLQYCQFPWTIHFLRAV